MEEKQFVIDSLRRELATSSNWSKGKENVMGSGRKNDSNQVSLCLDWLNE